MEEQVQCPWAPVSGGNVSMLAAGPSQGSLPFPHTQTESNCSHHWFKLENGSVSCKGGKNPRCPGSSILAPGAVGKGEGQHAPSLCPLARPLLIIA